MISSLNFSKNIDFFQKVEDLHRWKLLKQHTQWSSGEVSLISVRSKQVKSVQQLKVLHIQDTSSEQASKICSTVKKFITSDTHWRFLTLQWKGISNKRMANMRSGYHCFFFPICPIPPYKWRFSGCSMKGIQNEPNLYQSLYTLVHPKYNAQEHEPQHNRLNNHPFETPALSAIILASLTGPNAEKYCFSSVSAVWKRKEKICKLTFKTEAQMYL